MRERQAHYLRPVSDTRVPRSHLVVDVETRQALDSPPGEQVWRLACSQHITSHASRGWSRPRLADYFKPWELWAHVNQLAVPSHRLVIWCHNLAFDLRASQALEGMAGFGFTLEGISLEPVGSWARFERDGATVSFCDLLAWLPSPLGRIASDIGASQPPRPAPDADDDAWLERCRADVDVARQAVQQISDLILEQGLGPWRQSGAGQSHAAWRTRWLTAAPLVHDDLAVLAAEREAAWTGRCEAWRHGTVNGTPITEYDLTLAYAMIGRDQAVPRVLIGKCGVDDVDAILRQSDDYALLARCRIDTDVECVPAHLAEHIGWPVGSFETVLWDPELRLALEQCRQVEVLEAFVYRAGPVLRDACAWLIDQLQGRGGEITPLAGRVYKHWCRALVGRCALHYRDWQPWGYDDQHDVKLGLVQFGLDGQVREMLQVGNQILVCGDLEEAPDSLPQITGWIVSECRRRLWELMCAAGLEHLYYVDTDSLIVSQQGARRLDAYLESSCGYAMTVKGQYHHARFDGPRQLQLDDERRTAGIPLSARLDATGALRGEVFSSLRQDLAQGAPGRIMGLSRVYALQATDRRRQHLADGRTAPHTLPLDAASP